MMKDMHSEGAGHFLERQQNSLSATDFPSSDVAVLKQLIAKGVNVIPTRIEACQQKLSQETLVRGNSVGGVCSSVLALPNLLAFSEE